MNTFLELLKDNLPENVEAHGLQTLHASLVELEMVSVIVRSRMDVSSFDIPFWLYHEDFDSIQTFHQSLFKDRRPYS